MRRRCWVEVASIWSTPGSGPCAGYLTSDVGHRRCGACSAPGGRLFVRDSHPVLNSLVAQEVGHPHPDREQQPWITGPGLATPSLELPYWEETEALIWRDEYSYTGQEAVASPESMEWNHALSEIVMAVLDAGLVLRLPDFLE